ncbi:3,4-dihydroxy-2-butanone-4-phosphate synthase [Novosphingobium ovatum]|nr:3,4-dihydroxy-2-butanone-4-phosphate synthase [Novosphingobium ovatum]
MPAPHAPDNHVARLLLDGRMAILIDDEARESGGHMVIAAQHADDAAVNLMLRQARGLPCLCISAARAARLGLQPIPGGNGARHGTAFLPPIDGATLTAHPVSAQGRAQTIAAAIAPDADAFAVRMPGHVTPLLARPGGVLARAGLAEAAVDLASWAGGEAAVTCQILNAQGNVANRLELDAFARLHGLPLVSIRSLIAYRRQHDRLLDCVEERRMESAGHGVWTLRQYRNRTGHPHATALIKGRVAPDHPTLVRIHVADPLADMLHECGPRQGLIPMAMAAIAAAGGGVIVLIHPDLPAAPTLPVTALRDHGIGAEVLADLGVQALTLLSDRAVDPLALAAYGLRIVGQQGLRTSA